jgi:hypothetical protein
LVFLFSTIISYFQATYEQAKKAVPTGGGGEPAVKQLDSVQKTAFYVDAFSSVLNSLEEELIKVLPELFWVDLSVRSYFLLENCALCFYR